MEKHVDRNTSSHYCTEMIRGKTQQTINGKNGGASRPASAKLPQWPHFTKIQSTSWIKHSFSKRKTDMERKHIKLHILHVLLLLLNISGSDVSQTQNVTVLIVNQRVFYSQPLQSVENKLHHFVSYKKKSPIYKYGISNITNLNHIYDK